MGQSPWALASNDLEKYSFNPSDKAPLSLKLSSCSFYNNRSDRVGKHEWRSLQK
jgi:hypothetical protein